MYQSKIAGLGKYVPENVVTNDDLSKMMDTNDEWITERTGIKERRHIKKGMETPQPVWVRRPQRLLWKGLKYPKTM